MEKLDSSKVLRAENYRGKIPLGEISLMTPCFEDFNWREVFKEANNLFGIDSVVSTGIKNVIHGGPEKNEPCEVFSFKNPLENGEFYGVICLNFSSGKYGLYRFGKDFNFIS